jgi:hypothetical protein
MEADPQVESPGEFITGFHGVHVPVADPWVSRDWYVATFNLEPMLDLETSDQVVGVVLRHSCGVTVGLHRDPWRAAAMKGFTLLSLVVPTRGLLDQTAERIDQLGYYRSPVTEGHLGWYFDLPDPDGILVRVHTETVLDAEDA